MCQCSAIRDADTSSESVIDVPEHAVIASDKREVTPEGFVLFRDVTIARTGEHLYGPSEVDPAVRNEPAPDGVFHISRSAKELFRPETIASLHGKPFTNDHPPDQLTPETFRHHIEGVILNPRRGTGPNSEEMIADILVMGLAALTAIDSGKTELSVGFRGVTDHWGGGYADQRQLLANHVALVTRARCGETCAINDQRYTQEITMKHSKIRRWFDAAMTGDGDAMKKIMDEADDDTVETPAVVAPDYGSRVDALETNMSALKAGMDDHGTRMASLEELSKGINGKMDALTSALAELVSKNDTDPDDVADDVPVGDDDVLDELPEELAKKDKLKDIKDSAYLASSFYQSRSKAEVIVPGVKLPIFDAAWSPKKTVGTSIHALRTTALKQALEDKDTAKIVRQVAGRIHDAAGVDALSIASTRMIFDSVAAVKASQNSNAVSASVAQGRENVKEVNASERFSAAARNYWKKA